MPTDLDPARTPDLIAADSVLHKILQSVASASGDECFREVVRCLSSALDVPYAVVAEYSPTTNSARSLAFWSRDHFVEPIEWVLAGTPCERVVAGEFCLHASGLRERFPDDKPLVELGAESYLGVPLRADDGATLGHLFVMDTRGMAAAPRNLAIFHIFAARAASELARRRMGRLLAVREEELRDLFDEAPIAYVHEGLDSRFIRANRAALRTLGIRPDEVEGTFGRSFIPETPEAQRRLREAFDSVGSGTDTSGVVLELRRRDTGKPLWIQWWSRPAPDGTYTRTMFIDITDRVLMEQEQARLLAQNSYLREEISASHGFEEIVGSSRALREVLQSVDRVAPTDSTVLIQGETGTGKELIARAIHERSQRMHAPFVKVNCAALPAGLVESEFFGHDKGAFTGAVAARKGRFEIADGGTIFLDEVGEVGPDVQVKLLRVLQESEFERVGGSQTVRVNVRVIAATNRDLAADVRAGRFRADLFYRLGVFPIVVPPLRERPEDIPMLASYFVSRIAPAIGKQVARIEPRTMERFGRYAWPGNIRELRNAIERAIILCDDGVLRVEEGEFRAAAVGAPVAAKFPSLEDMEREHIASALKQSGGAIAGPSGAARLLGVPPSTLRSRMQRLGIEP